MRKYKFERANIVGASISSVQIIFNFFLKFSIKPIIDHKFCSFSLKFYVTKVHGCI